MQAASGAAGRCNVGFYPYLVFYYTTQSCITAGYYHGVTTSTHNIAARRLRTSRKHSVQWVVEIDKVKRSHKAFA